MCTQLPGSKALPASSVLAALHSAPKALFRDSHLSGTHQKNEKGVGFFSFIGTSVGEIATLEYK